MAVPASPADVVMPHEPNIDSRMTTSAGGGATVVIKMAAWSLTKACAGLHPSMYRASGKALSVWRTSSPTTRTGSCHQSRCASESRTWPQSMSPTNRRTTRNASTTTTATTRAAGRGARFAREGLRRRSTSSGPPVVGGDPASARASPASGVPDRRCGA